MLCAIWINSVKKTLRREKKFWPDRVSNPRPSDLQNEHAHHCTTQDSQNNLMIQTSFKLECNLWKVCVMFTFHVDCSTSIVYFQKTFWDTFIFIFLQFGNLEFNTFKGIELQILSKKWYLDSKCKITIYALCNMN